jgi:hypothetical protein
MMPMSNELFLDIAIFVVDIAILIVVTLESYFAISTTLKPKRKLINLKPVVKFVRPKGILCSRPLEIPVRSSRPSSNSHK